VLIDVAISGHRNEIKIVAENTRILKCKDILIEIIACGLRKQK